MDWLVGRGLDVAAASVHGHPMQCAILFGSFSTVEKLAAAGAPVLFRSGEVLDALHASVMAIYDAVPKVKLCLGLGADPNARIGPTMGTALDTATYCWEEDYRPDIVDLLLAHGADVELRENNGMSVLGRMATLIADAPTPPRKLPTSTAAAVAALLVAGAPFPEGEAPLPGLETALVPVQRKAPAHLPRLFQLLEPAVQAHVRAALLVLHRFLPEQALRMNILEFALNDDK